MKITRYPMNVDDVPVDFRADPDGDWDYDGLLEAAGFSHDEPSIRIGALSRTFRGHQEGCAVVSGLSGERMVGRYYAIIDPRSDAEANAPPRMVHVLPLRLSQHATEEIESARSSHAA